MVEHTTRAFDADLQTLALKITAHDRVDSLQRGEVTESPIGSAACAARFDQTRRAKEPDLVKLRLTGSPCDNVMGDI
jgi:hypothetical protein